MPEPKVPPEIEEPVVEATREELLEAWLRALSQRLVKGDAG